MVHFKLALALLALAFVVAQAKPSHPFGFHGAFDHLDLAPPVFPATPFHAGQAVAELPYHHHHHAPLLPPAHFHAHPLFAAPAPLLPAPAHLLPAPAHLLPAPAHLLPAPAHLLPAPATLLHAPAHLLPAPVPVLPTPVVTPLVAPTVEALPVVESHPIPTYRAIAGPKTTTHHVSLGYAFPQPHFAKLHSHVHAVPHAHRHAASLTLAHHHHHSLF